MKKLIISIIMLFLMSISVFAFSATRSISGQSISVNAEGSGGLSYAVTETLPSGCTALNINQGGYFNSGDKKIRWSFLDTTSRTLSYQVSCSSGTISGVIAGGDPATSKSISGDTQIGGGGTPTYNLQLVTKSATTAGNTIIATIKIKNIGTTIAPPFLVEIQPISSTQSVYTISPAELTCDPNTPSNVHKVISNLAADGTATFTLRTPPLSDGYYDVYGLSYTDCAANGGVAIAPLSYNSEGRTFITKLGVSSEVVDVCGDGICAPSEACTCLSDCTNRYCGDGCCDDGEVCAFDCDDNPPPSGNCLTSEGCKSSGKCEEDEKGKCVSSCMPFFQKWKSSEFDYINPDSGCEFNMMSVFLVIGGIFALKMMRGG